MEESTVVFLEANPTMHPNPRRCLLVLVGLVATLLTALPAYGYLDPASGSIFLQLLLGGIAGAALFLKLTWHRIRAFFRRDERSRPSDPVSE